MRDGRAIMGPPMIASGLKPWPLCRGSRPRMTVLMGAAFTVSIVNMVITAGEPGVMLVKGSICSPRSSARLGRTITVLLIRTIFRPIRRSSRPIAAVLILTIFT